MSTHEQQAALLLNSINEIGPARFQSLINKFGSCQAALGAGISAWREVPLFDQRTVLDIGVQIDTARKSAEKDWEAAIKSRARIYLAYTGAYPTLLSKIAYPPPVLYVHGEDVAVDRPAVALVGSRRCSYYGEKMASRIAAGLADAGVTTVSGLARGIDTFVHRATLEAGGKTWAVIGSGLSVVYPPENEALAKLIEASGAIISEFPMNTRPFPGHFPRRNRIIAGLTLGTAVIEGGEKSGSLITARLAAEEGRDVFAVPGPVTSATSMAPNRLLQSGAALVQSADDILLEIGLCRKSQADRSLAADDSENYPETVRSMLSILGTEPMPREILAQRLNKQASQLSSLLLEMELKGLIRSVPGGGVLKT